MLLAKNANHAPCKDCERRHVGCHTICTEYKVYRENQNRILDERNQENISRPDIPRKLKKHIWKELKRR